MPAPAPTVEAPESAVALAEAAVDDAAPVADAPVVVADPAADASAVEPAPPADPPAAAIAPSADLPAAAAAGPAEAAAVPVTTAAPAPTAKANGSSALTVAPKTVYYDGVLQGNLNVTSASGCGLLGSTCKLTYSLEDSSNGGKATFGKVPVSLPNLPADAAGGAGSFTFLPYATWIDPAKPTNFPVATGSQSFSVRIRENTQFDQVMGNLPLIGGLATATINALQEIPLLSTLLAPLIGSSILATVPVNVGSLVGGKQVAYTYTVSSFDGTPISMNFFPASSDSLLKKFGNKQATIFNGPGLGSPGETNPYGLFQAGGTVPGLSLMRGQGLPAPFNQVPLGFNVITWDPRGEFASGGVLQMDSPFYEGRDVSALIDWANANTPMLEEDTTAKGGVKKAPSIAMLGGSYGGGIQMTTVDPRIKTIVPAIAWNSLNQSLYPNNVFKTGWANALAEALLLPEPQLSGTDQPASSIGRINSAVTEALITGNLFGFISEAGQAVLASSGPTSLLTKLSIPTMYNQGIVDALFPLQQAVENAQTQLQQDPFFSRTKLDTDVWFTDTASDLVKLLWFCGGHGVCTNQTLAQQTKQNSVMFLENLIWANAYAKEYLQDYDLDPPIKISLPGFDEPIDIDNTGEVVPLLISAIANFQFWDQNGNAWVSANGVRPWDGKNFYNIAPITAADADGGRINSFTSVSGPLSAKDPAGAVCESISQACEFPLNQVFATRAKNAVNVAIPLPQNDVAGTCGTAKPGSCIMVVGAPTVSFTYSGQGNAKAVYAQIVDNATGQVLGNINTPIPVTLDGKERTIDAFPLANIVYSPPAALGASLTLQIVANSSLYKNNAVIWSVDVSDISVTLPTSGYGPLPVFNTPQVGPNIIPNVYATLIP